MTKDITKSVLLFFTKGECFLLLFDGIFSAHRGPNYSNATDL